MNARRTHALAQPQMGDADVDSMCHAFRLLAEVKDDGLTDLVARTTRRTFARGDWLLRGGDVATSCFFLSKGLVRELYIDEDGVEHTRRFLAEGQVTGSLVDLLSAGPSVTWIQALEDVHALVWRYADLDVVCLRHADMQTVARRSAEALYVFKTRREHELLALSAAQPHARWLRDHAALDARVSRRHLASYLGVTPEHLSRLRQERLASPAHPGTTRRSGAKPKRRR